MATKRVLVLKNGAPDLDKLRVNIEITIPYNFDPANFREINRNFDLVHGPDADEVQRQKAQEALPLIGRKVTTILDGAMEEEEYIREGISHITEIVDIGLDVDQPEALWEFVVRDEDGTVWSEYKYVDEETDDMVAVLADDYAGGAGDFDPIV